MALLSWPTKDPDEVLDYQMDWSARLNGDTITASTWAVVGAGLTVQSNSFSATSTTVWLAGGTLATKYLLTNRVTTTGARVMEQTVALKIKAK